MSNPRAILGFNEQFLEALTFKTTDTNLTKANYQTNIVNIAQPYAPAVSMSASETVTYGAAGDRLVGGVVAVDTDGFASVQVGGTIRLKYSGTAPAIGSAVECAGDGTVRVATANNVASDNTVYSIDTTNTLVYVNLH